MLIQADLSGGPGSLREVLAAGEPLNPEVIEQVQAAVGAHPAGRLRPDRDDGGGGQHPGVGGQARLDGAAAARHAGGAGRPGHRASAADEGEICLDLSSPAAAADDRIPGRSRAERRGDGRRLLPHRRRRAAGRRGLHHLHRARRRRLQGQRLQDQPVRAGERADRAPGGRRGRRGPGARPGAGRRPQGLHRPRRRATSPPGRPRCRSCAHARENLAPFLRVRRIEFAELPKTVSGKIRRVELRQREEELSPTGGSPTEFSDTDFPELRG